MFVLRYKSLNLDDYRTNADVIKSIRARMEARTPCSLLLYGDSGAGKSTVCQLLMREGRGRVKYVTPLMLAQRNFSDDILRYYDADDILVFDNVQHYTNVAEKQILYNIVCANQLQSALRLVFITNHYNNKFVQEKLMKKCECFRFELPSFDYVRDYVQRVCDAEHITLHQPIDDIIRDHHRHLDSILHYIQLVRSHDVRTGSKYGDLPVRGAANHSALSTSDIVEELLFRPFTSYRHTRLLIKYSTFVLPMFLYSNFYRSKQLTLHEYQSTVDAMRHGDIVEYRVFHEQQWFLNDTHIMHSIIQPSYTAQQSNGKKLHRPIKLIQYFNKKAPVITDKMDIFHIRVIERYTKEARWKELRDYVTTRHIALDDLLRRFNKIKLIPIKTRRSITNTNSAQ